MSTNHDERIVATHQRWAARGMVMMIFALNIDLLVRLLILKQEPRQWLDIGLIWMGTSLYVCIGMTASGVQLYGGKWSKHWLVILTIVATNAVVWTLMGMGHGLADLSGVIVGAATGVFLMLMILRGIYSVWERRTLGRGPREE
ncbi:MAG: hypothetical protein OEV33_00690 [Armatimonadota bacterium]|nr:hypothetical protein [Armatimonadota bacterium]